MCAVAGAVPAAVTCDRPRRGAGRDLSMETCLGRWPSPGAGGLAQLGGGGSSRRTGPLWPRGSRRAVGRSALHGGRPVQRRGGGGAARVDRP